MSRPGRASASQLLRWLREDRQSGPGRADRVWKAARAGGASERPTVQDGRWLRLDAAHLAVQPDEGERPADAVWRSLARDAGLHPSTLQAFNHRRRSDGPERPWTQPRLPRLRVGRRVFLPSTDEVLLARCVQHAGGRVARGLRRFAALSSAHNLDLLRAARGRASGRIGRAYSNAGLDGAFLSPNGRLAGASDAPGRWERIEGRREHLIRWGADFWKCSVYLQDVVHHAGFVPHMSDHDHYLVAGKLHLSDHFKEHGRDRAAPGDVWQRWGGDGVEQSHTGVLASFVEVRPLPPPARRHRPARGVELRAARGRDRGRRGQPPGADRPGGHQRDRRGQADPLLLADAAAGAQSPLRWRRRRPCCGHSHARCRSRRRDLLASPW